MAYTTAEDVGDFLQTEFTTSTDITEAMVNTWIAQADTRINNKLGFVYDVKQEADFLIQTEGIKDIWLPRDKTPIVSVATVELNTGSEFDPVWTSVTEGTDRKSVV